MMRVTTPDTTCLAIAVTVGLGVLIALELVPVLQRPLEPLCIVLARATEYLLVHIDMAVQRDGAALSHPDGFGYRVAYECSGIRPGVLIAAGIVAVRATMAQRIVGILLAIFIIEIMNVVRLMHLYWLGVHQPEAFFAAHHITWNVIAVVGTLAYFAIWLHVTVRRPDGPHPLPAASGR